MAHSGGSLSAEAEGFVHFYFARLFSTAFFTLLPTLYLYDISFWIFCICKSPGAQCVVFSTDYFPHKLAALVKQ